MIWELIGGTQEKVCCKGPEQVQHSLWTGPVQAQAWHRLSICPLQVCNRPDTSQVQTQNRPNVGPVQSQYKPCTGLAQAHHGSSTGPPWVRHRTSTGLTQAHYRPRTILTQVQRFPRTVWTQLRAALWTQAWWNPPNSFPEFAEEFPTPNNWWIIVALYEKSHLRSLLDSESVNQTPDLFTTLFFKVYAWPCCPFIIFFHL